MFTETELNDLDKLSHKHSSVLKLLNFWKSTVEDGFVAAKIAVNKKWLDLSADIEKADITITGDDKIYESFLKTTKLFEDIGKTQSKKDLEKSDKGKGKKNQSFTDEFANDKS